MNGKYIGVVVGAVVAIMLVGSLLMPTINDVSHTESSVPAEGAYGFMSYQPEPETSTQTNIYYIQATTVGTGIQISDGQTVIATIANDDFLNTDQIYYADSNVVIYVSDGALKADYDGQTITASGIKGFYVRAYTSCKISFADQTLASAAPIPSYYYRIDPNGDYANFEGDTPPSMDTPSVSVAGMYIGPKETVTETQAPGYAIYVAIPLIILVSLLVAVAAVAFKRQY